jgi:hypothetical protein
MVQCVQGGKKRLSVGQKKNRIGRNLPTARGEERKETARRELRHSFDGFPPSWLVTSSTMSAHGDGHMLQSLQAFMNDIAAPPVPPKKKRSRDASLAAPHSDAKRVRGEKEAAMLSALEAAVAAERLVPESAAPAAPSGPVRLQAAPTNHRIDDMFQGRHQQVAAGYAAKRGEMTAAGVKRAAAAAAASSIAAKPKNAAQRAAQVQNVPRYIQDNQLGKEQLRGVRMIMDASGTRLSGRNCFVSGPGGAGSQFDTQTAACFHLLPATTHHLSFFLLLTINRELSHYRAHPTMEASWHSLQDHGHHGRRRVAHPRHDVSQPDETGTHAPSHQQVARLGFAKQGAHCRVEGPPSAHHRRSKRGGTLIFALASA